VSSLLNTNEVIDVLGGTLAVAWLTGRGKTAVSNWRRAQRFPPNTYVTLTAALSTRGLSAPPWLWAMGPRPDQRQDDVAEAG
jgi:hypothetical protein